MVIPHWRAKLEYLVTRQGGECPIGDSIGNPWPAEELHHTGVHNTKVNRRMYPLYIHSLWNLLAVNHECHMQRGSFGRISYLEAAKREAFLFRHPMISEWMNNP